ncbi:MAG: hypothetical protein FJW37_02570 [Acidobacteria bacterium]|nr:hypothetical protein [Acidobacteriota bacterium]
MFAALHSPDSSFPLLECARSFSPFVERSSGQTVVFDISSRNALERLQKLCAGAAAGVSAAVARNPDTAIYAARGLGGFTRIAPGREAEALRNLPLGLLGAAPGIRETLERWGVRTFGELGALPEKGIVERLGAEGGRLRKLARGEFERPLVPPEDEPRFEEEMDLEHPLELLEPLSFLLARLLDQLLKRVEAVAALRLRLTLENGAAHERSLRLPVPMRDPRTLLKLLQLYLQAHPPEAPIVKVWISAEASKPRALQHGLFLPLAPEPDQLELTLARIASLAGEANVGSPELCDTHRPGAFVMRRFAATRSLNRRSTLSAAYRTAGRPLGRAPSGTSGGLGPVFPQASRVEAVKAAPDRWPPYREPPQRVFRPPRQADGIWRNVVQAAGPWRTSGDWWTADPWARDQWDVALADGSLYRIFRDLASERWFLEASYD